jgi:hypothetical protein
MDAARGIPSPVVRYLPLSPIGREGAARHGLSALIDLIAQKPRSPRLPQAGLSHRDSLQSDASSSSARRQVRPAGVVKLGSQDVNGTFRGALPKGCSYIGIDMEPGKNVDLVYRGTHIALPDGAADVTVASSVFEHDPIFWMTFLELCRITKPGGFIYINAPSNGVVHRHPMAFLSRCGPGAGLLGAVARVPRHVRRVLHGGSHGRHVE